MDVTQNSNRSRPFHSKTKETVVGEWTRYRIKNPNPRRARASREAPLNRMTHWVAAAFLLT